MARSRFVCLALVLVTLLVYLPVRHFEFINLDDPVYVSENPVVQAGLTVDGLKWAFSGPHASNWHPLTWLSHMLDCQLFGNDPGAAHLVNAIIHAANAALVFLLLFQLTGGFWPAAFAAALFAWHPLRVESVAWISERKDVLSAFFGLLALLAYLRHARERRPRDFWLTLLCFALGILAKPMLVTLPFVLLLLDYWPLRRWQPANPWPTTPRQLVLEKWPFFLISAVVCVITVRAQHDEAIVSLAQLPLGLRVANALTTCLGYLEKMVAVGNLTICYPPTLHIDWPMTLLAAAVLVFITGFAWWTRRRMPSLLVGWLWFLGTLVPVIGIVQVGSQSMADRYTYLPMIGVLIALTGTVQDLVAQKRSGLRGLVVIGVIFLGSLLVNTSFQLPYWRDSVTLFSHAVAVTPDNAVANMNLGAALESRGEKEKAAACYREVLRIAPNAAEAHNGLAGVLEDQGQYPQAEEQYRAALRLKPAAALTYCSLGTLLVKMGRFDEAMQAYTTAAQLRPRDSHPHYLMAKALLRQGRSAEAVVEFKQALQLFPEDVKSQVYLARLLATSEDAGIRDGAQAIALAERANTLTGGQQAFVLDTLAAAYAEAGRFADAEKTVRQAIGLATKALENDTVAELQVRLKLYQAHEAYRESSTTTQVDTERSRATSR